MRIGDIHIGGEAVSRERKSNAIAILKEMGVL
jgi:hypothetical protein